MERTKLRELFRCEVCGNVVEIAFEGMVMLVCCNKPMNKIEAKTASEEGKEKHVPVIEEQDNGILVKVGSVPHPMEEKHYIAFIEVLTEKKIFRHELKPMDKPEVFFPVKKSDIKEVREFCNIHMLWKA